MPTAFSLQVRISAWVFTVTRKDLWSFARECCRSGPVYFTQLMVLLAANRKGRIEPFPVEPETKAFLHRFWVSA